MFCLNPLFFNQVPLTLRFGNNFYFHFCYILAKKKPEEGRVSNVVLQKVCYFTSTDCYPGQTNKLVKAKPDLSTTEERGKKGKKQNKRKPKQTKTPKATTTAKCLAKFTTLMIPKTFETFKAIPEIELWFEKCFLKVAEKPVLLVSWGVFMKYA